MGVPGVLDAGEPFRRPTHGQRGHQLRLAHPRRRATGHRSRPRPAPKPHRGKRRGQHRRNHPMDDQPIQDPTWRPQRHRRPRGTVQGARQGRESIGRIAQHRHIFRQVEPYGIPVEQHRNRHRGNIGPCRSGTAVRRAIRLRRHPRRLQRHRRQRSDLPRRTHRHHGRARRRLAGNRHERPAHRTPVGQNRPS